MRARAYSPVRVTSFAANTAQLDKETTDFGWQGRSGVGLLSVSVNNSISITLTHEHALEIETGAGESSV